MIKDIHPIFDRMESREEKEQHLGQHGLTIWFTGLSGSGKSTVAVALERELSSLGYMSRILDGDNVRSGINSDLGFSEADRRENIRRVAEVCKLFTDTGIITLAAFVSPTTALRKLAREIVGKEHFFEIYVSTPLEECEHRDVKGLYAKARSGALPEFTGITAPFEKPEHPELQLDTTHLSVEECVRRVVRAIIPIISIDPKSTY
ncbi:MAG: adenylyl-sulfate kinase [Alistipes sp.]|nr:adenylyl-sulfate kinase [Alistipes sp.]